MHEIKKYQNRKLYLSSYQGTKDYVILQQLLEETNGLRDDYTFYDCSKDKTNQEEKFLLSVLIHNEDERAGNTRFLNRIIRNGGFINHVRNLE